MKCTKCGKSMILRTRKSDGVQFYGCSGFPRCKSIVNLEDTVKNVTPIQSTNIVGSPQQNAIWQEIREGTKHLMVIARAGTGKSFTSLHGSSMLGNLKVGFCAFNKHIAEELKGKGVNAFTCHSLGYKAYRSVYKYCTLDEFKVDNIVDGILREYDYDNDDVFFIQSVVTRLVSFCKFNLLEGTPEDIEYLSLHHNIDLNDKAEEVIALIPRVLKLSLAQKNVIDYDDMIYMPLMLNIPVQQFDALFVDEAQDLNKAQQALVMKAIGDKGRMIVVGDPKQSIYGFTGADINSMQTFETLLNNTDRGVTSLPLTVTRRCPASHVRLAQEIVPDLEAMDTAPEGEILTMSLLSAQDRMKAGDMVICRVNAPLIKICYELIRSGVKAFVRGRDIGKGISALIKKLKAKNLIDLHDKLEIYRKNETQKLEKKGKKANGQILALNDKIDTVIALSEGLSDLIELHAKVKQIFSDADTKNAVLLSSIHKCKGLEAENVFIIEPSKIPHPMAMHVEWQLEQEWNIKYIAFTRAKKVLIIVEN